MLRLIARPLIISLWIGCLAVTLVLLVSRTPAPTALSYIRYDARLGRTINYFDYLTNRTVTQPAERGKTITYAPMDVHRGVYVTPRLMPTGTDLFVVLPDMTNAEQLTRIEKFPPSIASGRRYRNNTSPQWSPDEQWIAFLSTDAQLIVDIYLIRLNGSGLHRIAHNLGTPSPRMGWGSLAERDLSLPLLVLLVIAPPAVWIGARRLPFSRRRRAALQ